MPARPEHRPELPFLPSGRGLLILQLPRGVAPVWRARCPGRPEATCVTRLAWSTCREPAGSQVPGRTGRRIGDEPSVPYPLSLRRLKQHLHSLIARPGQFCPTPRSGRWLRPVPRGSPWVCWAPGGAACLPEAPPGALGCPARPACRAWWVKPVLTLCPSGLRCAPAPVWAAVAACDLAGLGPTARPHTAVCPGTAPGGATRCCDPSSNV